MTARDSVLRGYRNNNPGNIRNSGVIFDGEIRPSADANFKQFKDMRYGYRAMFKVLRFYFNAYSISTIDAWIKRWAPSSDGNNTEAYIKSVCKMTGISRFTDINPYCKSKMIAIVSAISRIENGVDADYDIVSQAWDLTFKD